MIELKNKMCATVKLLKPGFARVLEPREGLTFPVDNWHYNVDRTIVIVHVRDYRYPAGNPNPRHPQTYYQIWSMHLGRDCEEIDCVTFEGPRV